MGIADRHIVFVGLMGSGKSSVGRRIAQATSRKFVDTDRVVEEILQQSVRDIFETKGEDEFRRHETDALRNALSAEVPSVIAAAGGVVLSEVNRRLMKDATQRGEALVVWLHTEPHELLQRVQRGTHRPLLDADPAGTLETMSSERHSLYADVATHIVETNGYSLEQVASSVCRVLGISKGGSNG